MAGCGGNVDWAMRFIAAPLAFEGEVKAMLVKAFKTGIDQQRDREMDQEHAVGNLRQPADRRTIKPAPR